jgi:hypothetical protein
VLFAFLQTLEDVAKAFLKEKRERETLEEGTHDENHCLVRYGHLGFALVGPTQFGRLAVAAMA